MENYMGLALFYLLLWLGIRLYNSKDDFSFLGGDCHEEEDTIDDQIEDLQSLLEKLPDGWDSIVVAVFVVGKVMEESINIFGLLIVSQIASAYYYVQMVCIATAVIAMTYTVIDTYNHYLYVNRMIYDGVTKKSLLRYIGIYRVKLLSDYTDTFIYAVSIMAAIFGIAILIAPSL